MAKLAAFHTLDAPHLLDHLAPLCFALGMPLLTLKIPNRSILEKYYPFIKTEYFSNLIEIQPQQLAEKWDLLFQSVFWLSDPIKVYAELLNKKICLAYVPHGNSDKGYRFQIRLPTLEQDMILFYGNHMIDLLKKQNLIREETLLLRTGNFRYLYYLKFKEFYDDLAEKEIFSKFNKTQKTLLYAPTWQDGENSSSFFLIAEKLIKNLPSSFNLIVKCHPHLLSKNPAEYHSVIHHFIGKKNVLLLEDFFPVYPILNRVDGYLGDFSSVGYDFLTFQKPMFFLDVISQKFTLDPSHFLHQAGYQIPKNQYKNIFSLIEKHWEDDFTQIQKKLYHYTFGETLLFEEFKKNLLDALRIFNNDYRNKT